MLIYITASSRNKKQQMKTEKRKVTEVSTQTQTLYFIERVKKIEGSFLEIDTLGVEEHRQQAMDKFEDEAKKETRKNFGVTVTEYEITAEATIFQKLIRYWQELPGEIFRMMRINDCQLVDQCLN